MSIDGRLIRDPGEVAEALNSHFYSRPHNIASGIPESNEDFMNLVPVNPTYLYFSEVTPSEVHKFITYTHKNGNINDITLKFLKICIDNMSLILSEFFNLCFDSGIFPENLKISKITPVFKKGSRLDVGNYRPIAIVPNLGKIFECIIHSRLLNFFQSSNLLHENQFGFRKGKNTEMAALSLVEKVLPALENKKYAICIFLDFTACFDTINRNILFKKLNRYGVRGICLQFMKSYFEDRRQSVCVGGSTSETIEQEIGIIQGSRLGPLLFDIYSNDLNELCTENENIIYADDTCLVYSNDDLQLLTQIVNVKLDRIFNWCNYNKLSINPSKSEFLVVTHRSIGVEPSLAISTDPILRKNAVRYLGLMVDDKLKFSNHIKNLKGRMSILCGITYRLNDYLNLNAAKKMYFSFVYSVLSYCVVVWGGAITNSYVGRKLIERHEKIVQNLFRKFSNPNSCFFKSHKLLKLEDIHKFYAAIYMYKIIILRTSSIIQQNELEYLNHEYNTRGRDQLILPFPRVNAVRLNYKYQCVKVWNELPLEIRNSQRIGIFKKKVTDYFLNLY